MLRGAAYAFGFWIGLAYIAPAIIALLDMLPWNGEAWGLNGGGAQLPKRASVLFGPTKHARDQATPGLFLSCSFQRFDMRRPAGSLCSNSRIPRYRLMNFAIVPSNEHDGMPPSHESFGSRSRIRLSQ